MPLFFKAAAFLTGLAFLVSLFALVLRSNTAALIVIFTCAFLQGSLDLFLGIPTFLSRGLMELCILFLFAKAFYGRLIKYQQPVRLVGHWPMAGLFAVSIVSYIMNGETIIRYALFFRHLFIFYIFFISLLNLNIAASTVARVNRYIVLLFLVQLPAAVEKFFRVGFQEGGGIGTVSAQAGSLSTIVPLFAMAFLFSFYLWRRKSKYIWLIPFFVAFGIVGEKRAVAFFVPVVLMFMYGLFLWDSKGYRRVPSLGGIGRIAGIAIVIMLISIGGIYAGGRVLRSLNPETTVGGAFDPGYIVDTIVEYETMVVQTGETFGRITTTLYSFELLHGRGTLELLFGLGPGLLVDSSLLDETEYERFRGLGIVSGKTGLVWIALQVGILGSLCVLFLYLRLFRKALYLYHVATRPYSKAILLGLLGACFVFVFDFVGYSPATLVTGSVTPVFFYIAAMSFTRLNPFSSGPAWTTSSKQDVVVHDSQNQGLVSGPVLKAT
jgi:hypothetical protein